MTKERDWREHNKANCDPVVNVLREISGAGLLSMMGFPVMSALARNRDRPIKIDTDKMIMDHLRESHDMSGASVSSNYQQTKDRRVYDVLYGDDWSGFEVTTNRRGTKVLGVNNLILQY